MVIKSLVKNPLLMIGLLMCFIAINEYRDQLSFLFRNHKVLASSCRSALVQLQKNIPKKAKIQCLPSPETTQALQQNLEILQITLPPLHDLPSQSTSELYRALAQNIAIYSLWGLEESLENVFKVHFLLRYPPLKLEILAVLSGKDFVYFRYLKDGQAVLKHLQEKVIVKETSYE
jgi:hypothetical protein